MESDCLCSFVSGSSPSEWHFWVHPCCSHAGSLCFFVAREHSIVWIHHYSLIHSHWKTLEFSQFLSLTHTQSVCKHHSPVRALSNVGKWYFMCHVQLCNCLQWLHHGQGWDGIFFILISRFASLPQSCCAHPLQEGAIGLTSPTLLPQKHSLTSYAPALKMENKYLKLRLWLPG